VNNPASSAFPRLDHAIIAAANQLTDEVQICNIFSPRESSSRFGERVVLGIHLQTVGTPGTRLPCVVSSQAFSMNNLLLAVATTSSPFSGASGTTTQERGWATGRRRLTRIWFFERVRGSADGGAGTVEVEYSSADENGKGVKTNTSESISALDILSSGIFPRADDDSDGIVDYAVTGHVSMLVVAALTKSGKELVFAAFLCLPSNATQKRQFLAVQIGNSGFDGTRTQVVRATQNTRSFVPSFVTVMSEKVVAPLFFNTSSGEVDVSLWAPVISTNWSGNLVALAMSPTEFTVWEFQSPSLGSVKEFSWEDYLNFLAKKVGSFDGRPSPQTTFVISKTRNKELPSGAGSNRIGLTKIRSAAYFERVGFGKYSFTTDSLDLTMPPSSGGATPANFFRMTTESEDLAPSFAEFPRLSTFLAPVSGGDLATFRRLESMEEQNTLPPSQSALNLMLSNEARVLTKLSSEKGLPDQLGIRLMAQRRGGGGGGGPSS
jgi:hypothetical protein